MARFRDPALEREFLLQTGLEPRAAAEVFGDLTAYLHQPLDAVAQRYWRYRQTEDVEAQRRVAEATQESDVLAYYAATPHYLYELSYWEASRDKQAWFKVLAMACRRYGLRRVVDFGGGVGGLCVALRSRGIACDYLDVAGNTFTYAAWRFARRRLPVQMFNAMDGWPAAGQYDAVITWDVLEHLFDLEDAVHKIARLLRPGGWFLSKSTFAVEGGHHLDIHLAKHARYADVRELNRMVSQHGFEFVGQLKPTRFSRVLRACGWRDAVAGIRVAPRLKHGGNFLVHRRGKTT